MFSTLTPVESQNATKPYFGRMSWGRGVHNEKLKRSQRLALQKDGGTLQETLVTRKKMTLKVLQYGSSEVNDVELEGEVLADNLEKQFG